MQENKDCHGETKGPEQVSNSYIVKCFVSTSMHTNRTVDCCFYNTLQPDKKTLLHLKTTTNYSCVQLLLFVMLLLLVFIILCMRVGVGVALGTFYNGLFPVKKIS